MNASTPVVTRGQRMAQSAFGRIQSRAGGKDKKEFAGFAKRFPALIHSCGLAQALAFAQAKAPDGYLDDLAVAMNFDRKKDVLLKEAREAALAEYMRLSREALEAAGWLKRYAEVLLDEDAKKGGGDASVS